MATLYTQQSSNIRKTWFLMTGFLLGIILLGVVLSYVYGNPNLLYIAFFFSILLNISVSDLEKVIYFAGYIITKVHEDEKETILYYPLLTVSK